MSLPRIYSIVVKELKQLSRDRLTFGMIVMVPLVQLLMFGYAINTDVRQVPAALVDLNQSSYSRATVQSLEASQAVKFVRRFSQVSEAEQAITRGEVKAALIIPADYTARLLFTQSPAANNSLMQFSPQRPLAQWLVDGSDTMIAGVIKGLRVMPLDEILGARPRQLHSYFEVVLYFNPEQRSVVNIVPGLLGVILTMTMILFTSVAIVREREQGNMEFLITTPVKPMELMIGKIIPYILVGLIQTLIIVSLGWAIFAVPVAQDLHAFLVVTLIFIFASLTLGLILSTIAKTQLQAMQMTVFVLLPSILLSGFMFPYEAMPRAAQWLAEVLPATHFMRSIRAVVLRDAHVSDLWPDILWLAGFSLLGLWVAAKRFHKRLD